MTKTTKAIFDLEGLFRSAPRRYPELRGSTALITGGAQSIGLAIAARFAAEGMRVVLCDLEGDPLREAEVALNRLGVENRILAGDLAEIGTIRQLVDVTRRAFGRLDVLVNNAADLTRHESLAVDLGLLEHAWAVNVRAPFLCAQQAAQIMMQQPDGGVIVNLSSVGGLRAHQGGGMPYDATKGAVDAMTRALALDFAPYNVRVNALAPGHTHTVRTEVFAATQPDEYRALIGRVPLGRSGTLTEMASAAAFLASPDAAYITGQVLYVDGAVTAQLSPPGQIL